MRLPVFGRKAAAPPVQSRYPMASFGGAGGMRAGGYEAEVRAGFVRNPIAQRAIRTVAEGVAGAPFEVTPADHPLAAILARPAPGMSGTAFLEGVATWLLLSGNAYVETVTGAEGMPAELYALRPERVTIEADARGWPSADTNRP